jgi:D-alanyl-D-alanine carboxypeptidase (penicillin-binding protein 5/6)
MMMQTTTFPLRFPARARLCALALATHCFLAGGVALAQEQAAPPQDQAPVAATPVPTPAVPVPAAAGAALPQVVPRPPEIAASSYILLDAATGEVLVEHNADQSLAPASLTKIMTTYIADTEIAAGNISLDDEVFVSVKAWQTEGSKMFIQEGTHVRLEDIMRGVIIQSGNDASIALAEHIAGSEEAFADLMNQHAAALGMTHSHFMNASGLPAEGHVASARDLSTLARAVITRFPEPYKMYGEREFTYNNIRQPNRNTLLFSDRSVDGMKTGFTDDAGYCLVGSAVRDGMRLITVVMGTASTSARAEETAKLLTYGFRFFETHQLFSGNEVLGNATVWSGAADEVPVGVQEPLVRTIQRGQAANLVTQLTLNENIKAPITVGQELGRVKVSLGDQVYYEGPVVALQDVERGNLWKRMMDWLYLFFLSLLS